MNSFVSCQLLYQIDLVVFLNEENNKRNETKEVEEEWISLRPGRSVICRCAPLLQINFKHPTT
jgi:hypothetical protein